MVGACRELGRKVLETCLSESAAESDSASVACPACGGEARRLRKRGCYIETLCGVVRVYRWVYRCDCGVSVVPWQLREGLKDGAYTLGVAKTMCRLSARLDFREAAEELQASRCAGESYNSPRQGSKMGVGGVGLCVCRRAVS